MAATGAFGHITALHAAWGPVRSPGRFVCAAGWAEVLLLQLLSFCRASVVAKYVAWFAVKETDTPLRASSGLLG